MSEQETISAASPYPGLRPYESEESENFFGRDEECHLLIDRILANRLTLLFAASGAGKTSLLRAAVLPALSDEGDENLEAVVHRDWVEEPLDDVKQTILSTLEASGQLVAEDFFDDLASASLSELVELCTLFVRPPLVLILDQFEEFFLYQRHARGFEDFLQQLADLVADRDLPVSVVISMREDFALELNALGPYLRGSIFENFFRLEGLGIDQAREAITGPVSRIGWRYEAKLLEELLEDLPRHDVEESLAPRIERPGQTVVPPNLQMVCSELWGLRQDDQDKTLRFKVYKAHGRAGGLTKRFIERELGKLSASEKRLASRAFDFLITRRGTKMAYPLGDLAENIGANEKALQETLDRLEASWILRRQKRRGVFWYELYHDFFSSIIEKWNRSFKAREWNRKAAIGAVLGMVALAGLFVAFDVALNLTSHHLRLGVKRGVSDTVDVYRGRPGSTFEGRLRDFVGEVGIERRDVERHREFDKRTLDSLETLEVEAAAFLPLMRQIETLWHTGQAEEALSLATRSISKEDMELSTELIGRLASIGSLEAQDYLADQLNAAIDEGLKSNIAEALTGYSRYCLDLRRVFDGAGFELKPDLIAALSGCRDEETALWLSTLLRNDALEGTVSSALTRIGEPALPALIEALEDPLRSESAILILKKLKDARSFVPLLRRMKDENSSVRASAAAALGALGNKEAIEPLRELLKDREEAVRRAGFFALAELGDQETTAYLLGVLKRGDSPLRREAEAIEALGSLGDPDAIQPLEARGLAVQDLELQIGVLESLMAIDTPEAARAALNVFEHSIDSGLLDSRMRGAKALVRESLIFFDRVNDPRLVPLVFETAKDSRWTLRDSAISALVKRGSDPKELSRFVKYLGNEDVRLRIVAVQVLERLGPTDLVEEIAQRLDDQDSRVWTSVVKILQKERDPRVRPFLIEKLQDANPEVRAEALPLLAEMEPHRIEELMLDHLGDPSIEVRSGAARNLRKMIPSQEVVRALLGLVEAPDPRLRALAIAALSQTEIPELLAPLEKLQRDPRTRVRAAAVRALGRLGNKQGLDAILRRSEDRQDDVRNAAIDASFRMGRSKKPDQEVRAYGLELLLNRGLAEQMADPEFIPYSWRLCRWAAEVFYPGNALVLKRLTESTAVDFSECPSGTLKEPSDMSVSKHLTNFLDADGLDRRNSIEFLRYATDQEEVVKALSDALSDEDKVVRMKAALALSGQENSEALAEVVNSVLRNSTTGVAERILALATLVALGDKDRLTELEQFAASRKIAVREGVAEILGYVKSSEGLPILMELASGPTIPVREAAIRAIGEIDDHRSVDFLRELATDSEAFSVRPALLAHEALGQMRTERANEAVLEAFEVNEDNLGFSAYWRLANTGSEGALELLQSSLQRIREDLERWRNLRDNARQNFSQEEEKEWAEELKGLRPWGTDARLWEIGHAMARLDREAGIGLLDDPLASVRQGAAKGLAWAADVELVARLDRERAERPEWPFRVASFRAIDATLLMLGRTEDEEVRSELLKLLDKESGVLDRKAVCAHVEWAIEQLDPEAGLERGSCEPLMEPVN